jgi:transcriptional regulator with AAA-type ATPase domain
VIAATPHPRRARRNVGILDAMKTETQEEEAIASSDDGGGVSPGLVVVYSVDRPKCLVLPLVDGALELGRDELAAAGIPDGRVSRRHVRVEHDGARFHVRDLDSRNGTFVDGQKVQTARQLAAPVVRIGRTLLLPVRDRRLFEWPGITSEGGVIMGPTLRAAHDRIAAIGRTGANLLVLGESGSGKELCAATFHAAGREEGRPLVAVNCATIPKELAERTLFGARRGAYTGAVTDAVGLVQAASGGTLFLDEIAELEPGVQAKLLRVLETKQVLPLGGVQPVAVDLRVCAATHKNLREEVQAGRFREDLYFRIGRPELRLPPLRARREEIPWLVQRALGALPAGARVVAGTEFIEACLLRPWPGNVRELLVEVTTAAIAARSSKRDTLTSSNLDGEAGRSLQNSSIDDPESSDRPDTPAPGAEALEAALRAEQGNVARAAARLGLSRSRLRRLIEREGIDVRSLRST